ncbi:MAG: hypothetical protein U0169_15210 [Polyangiaceae bacterium]
MEYRISHALGARASRAATCLALALVTTLSLGCSEGRVPSEPTTEKPTIVPPSPAAPAAPSDPTSPEGPRGTMTELPGHESLQRDMSAKEDERLMPAETLIRSYLSVFGGLAPLEAQTALRGRTQDAVFDAWTDYLGVLGVPDHRNDVLRNSQSNPLMLAAFERIGVALCDRALERDVKATPGKPVAERAVFAFDIPPVLDRAAFEKRFDVLHRTFLGYPVRLAPTDRTTRFFALYEDVRLERIRVQGTADAPKDSTFDAREGAWAAVCQGLVRHPEFHLY